MDLTHLSDTLPGVQVVHASEASETIGIAMDKPYEARGTAVEWGENITTGLALIIPLLIVLSYVLERRRSWFQVVNLLRFAALAALPLFLWVIGAFATFEGAKKVEFCHSCHTPMDPYVSDMEDPESATLAALHYKNRYIQDEQCYTCHADYGVFGTAEAKFTGLRHLYHWLTNSPTARAEQQIQAYTPYKNQLCLRCHAGSQRFLTAGGDTHLDLEDQLMAADPTEGMSCLECHGPAHTSLEDWKAARQEG